MEVPSTPVAFNRHDVTPATHARPGDAMAHEIPADVAAVREQYEARILGLHMPATVRQAAERFGDLPAFSDRFDVPEGETWSTISWAQTWEQTQRVAAALIDLGVEKGDPVAIMADNRTAHTLADYGAMTAAAVPMSIYNTPRPGPGRLHRGRVPTRRGDPRGPRPLPALGAGARRGRLDPPRRDAGRRRPRRRPARDDVGRLPRPRRRHQRRRGADGPDHARPAGDLPLHLGHDRQPQGRRAHPPQRDVRGRLDARQRRA